MRWQPILIAILFLGLAIVIDFDGDGWNTGEEARYGGNFLDGDADNDGVSDGWEHANGLKPFSSDSDRDGLSDAQELVIGSSPIDTDTDRDGVPDSLDIGFCGNQQKALHGDADQDFLLDNLDVAPCNPDQDGDLVLDGEEQNGACIERADCDFDGLPDGQEHAPYSPLLADSFGVGISDGVTFLFEQAGQEPSADEDEDGIPDAWEGSSGLIDWGPFTPQPGQTDFLIEFLVVSGPDSATKRPNLQATYRDVANMYAAEGIFIQWIETEISLASEPFLSFLEAKDQSEFLDLLREGDTSENPYVTSVVMLPQLEQETHGSVLGVAQIRSMLSVIDYGAHTVLQFDGLQFSPVVESYMRSGNEQALAAIGATAYAAGDEYALQFDDTVLRWDPFWFGDGIFVDDEFRAYQSTQLDRAGLASTIAHELGHTLGLCHAHEQDCYETFPLSEQQRRDTSTMSYNSGDVLHFLDSEWITAKTFLACPPEEILAHLASGDPVLQNKYAFHGDVLRTCGAFITRETNLEPASGTEVEPFPTPSKAPRGGTIWFVLYVLAGTAAITASFVLQGRSTSDSEDNLLQNQQ